MAPLSSCRDSLRDREEVGPVSPEQPRGWSGCPGAGGCRRAAVGRAAGRAPSSAESRSRARPAPGSARAAPLPAQPAVFPLRRARARPPFAPPGRFQWNARTIGRFFRIGVACYSSPGRQPALLTARFFQVTNGTACTEKPKAATVTCNQLLLGQGSLIHASNGGLELYDLKENKIHAGMF